MKKVFWFIVMLIAIPIDIVLWNVFMGAKYGYRSIRGCCVDNWIQWKKV